MRIHSLTMTAIGPYPGTERIDFDAFGDSGRFLLTGPTGSGKTTIIDAIVFALYGSVADADDSSKDRIRSTLAGPEAESVVELVFSTSAGVYRVRRTPPMSAPRSGAREPPPRAPPSSSGACPPSAARPSMSRSRAPRTPGRRSPAPSD